MENKTEVEIDITENEYQVIAEKAAELGMTAEDFLSQAFALLAKDIRDGKLPTH